MASQDSKKTDDQVAAEKAAAEKAEVDAAAAKAAAAEAELAKNAAKKADFVVAPDTSVITHEGRLVDAGGEVKPTDFHAKSAESKSAFDDLVKRGAIVKGG